MLNAPNGSVWVANRAVLPHGMPKDYDLYRDEDGYYWWHHGPTDREGPLHHDRWWVRRDAIEDEKRQSK